MSMAREAAWTKRVPVDFCRLADRGRPITLLG